MKRILVTGSNRGLGLEWVRQYVRLGWKVHATCRYPDQAEELHSLLEAYTNLSLHALDVTDPEQIQQIANAFAHEPLDLLVNNAGVYYEHWGKDTLGNIDYEDWLNTFRVNSLGAIRVTEALRASLARAEHPLVVAVTSHMGSISDINSPNDYAYRSSKAALNAVIKGLGYDLAPQGIGILLVHPGWVKTRMGGSSAPLTVEQSVSNMRKLVDGFSLTKSGVFYRHDGSIIPW